MRKPSQVLVVILCASLLALPSHQQQPHIAEHHSVAYIQTPSAAANSTPLAVSTTDQ